jgi:hypothetical protein
MTYIYKQEHESSIFARRGGQTSAHKLFYLNTGVKSIHINTDLATNSVIDSHSSRKSATIAVLPVEVDRGKQMFLKPSDSIFSTLISTHNIPSIRVWLTDEHRNLIDLGAHEFTVGLEFQYVRINILQKDIKDVRDRRLYIEEKQKQERRDKKKKNRRNKNNRNKNK